MTLDDFVRRGLAAQRAVDAALSREDLEAPTADELDEYEVVTAMQQMGGSFVQALSRAFIAADPINRLKLRAAFQEYWAEYSDLAKRSRGAR